MAVDFTSNMELAMENLHKRGAFLTVKSGDKVNTMTVSWGNIGFEWARPIFTVMVRKSRYTHELIDNNSEFTVSIPLNDDLKSALTICGTKSGRDVDKFKEANISLKNGRTVETPVISGTAVHYECKIMFKHEMNPSLIDGEVLKKWYSDGDYHVYYYGEIVDCYMEEANV